MRSPVAFQSGDAVYGSTQTYEESKSALSNNFRREERYYWSETDADVDLRHLC